MTPEMIAEYRQMMHENERLRAEVEWLRGAIRALLELDELKFSSHGAVFAAAKLAGADSSAADELQRLSEELDLP